jgi:hypothetical protein
MTMVVALTCFREELSKADAETIMRVDLNYAMLYGVKVDLCIITSALTS